MFILSVAPGTMAVSASTILPTAGPAVYSVSAAPSQYVSTNWSGYAVNSTKNSVTGVAGSWVVPAVTCNPSANDDQYVVMWAGIDGFTSTTVEQIGTLAHCVKGSSTPTYSAWYEFYPAQPSIVTIKKVAISPGDKVSATVSYSSSTKKFTVMITDLTSSKSFSKSKGDSKAMRSSAECIAEDPAGSTVTKGLFLLANFGTADFGTAYTGVSSCTATVSGVTNNFGSFGTSTDELTMCTAIPSCSTVMAQPSSLAGGLSFTDKWDNAGP